MSRVRVLSGPHTSSTSVQITLSARRPAAASEKRAELLISPPHRVVREPPSHLKFCMPLPELTLCPIVESLKNSEGFFPPQQRNKYLPNLMLTQKLAHTQRTVSR